MSVKDKRNVVIDPVGEPIKASAWRNITFFKDGSTITGINIYETEQAAKSFSVMRNAEWHESDLRKQSIGITQTKWWDGRTTPLFWNIYTIQLPVQP